MTAEPVAVLFLGFVFFAYVIQRLFELNLSAKNSKILGLRFNAKIADPIDSMRMKIVHILWFIAWGFEALTTKERVRPAFLIPILLILCVCQWVRFRTMRTLGEFWTIHVFKMDSHFVVKRGLYQWLRHPNYLAVIFEIFLVPILFKAYVTAIVFSFANAYVLGKRIRLEESCLSLQSDYSDQFRGMGRFNPLCARNRL